MIGFIKRWFSAPEPQTQDRTVHDLSIFAPGSPLTELIPKPAVRAEQFADVKAESRQQALLYAKVMRHNNANVTRDFGAGAVNMSTQREQQLAAQLGKPSEEDFEAVARFGILRHDRDGRDLVAKPPREYAPSKVAVLSPIQFDLFDDDRGVAYP
jgi:hypothetical protein